MHEAIKKCAEYGLVVDIHDEYRPTGFSRTYPNLMTQEGIRGNEEFPDATHNTILPFTRFIAGAADYTICYYRQDFGKDTGNDHGVPRGKVIKTTSAHQLALSVICYSPLQYMYWYDKPEDSQDEPELAFFDAVPTVWDDTKVISGEIGQFVTMARKSGDDWFIGTITNNDGRELKIPLDFLDEGKKYEATIYGDDPSVKTRTKVGIKKLKVDSSKVLDAKLMKSGGQAIWIKPVPN
jgi:alpha-glucosidase